MSSACDEERATAAAPRGVPFAFRLSPFAFSMRTGIALGSNLGDRIAHLRTAWQALRALPELGPPARLSRVYETAPVDAELSAEAFLNAVVEVEFDGQPIVLLDALQRIEAQMGRPSKRPRNASRTIDLDLLYAGNLVLNNREVCLPHPRLHLRAFVLRPLADLRPELILPGQERSVSELLAALAQPSEVRLFPGSLEP